MKTRLLFIIAIAFFLSSKPGWGESQGIPQEDALLTMMQLLETDISTKTDRRDLDRVPGVITVLLASELRARGVRDVSEAINLVTGFHLPYVPRTPMVRGFGGISNFSIGKNKFLLNGVALDTLYAKEEFTVATMPIELIDRIEVIRGPGSAIYGGHAYLGVINIVTVKNKDEAFSRIGKFNSRSIGGNFTHDHTNGANSSVQLNSMVTDGPKIDSGRDLLHSFGQGAISNSTGLVNTASRQDSFLYQYTKQGLKLSTHFVQFGAGDSFGFQGLLPSQSNRILWEQSDFSLDMEFKHTVSDTEKLKYTAGYKQIETVFDRYEGLPPGAFGLYPNGEVTSSTEGEDRYTMGLELTSKRFDSHTLLLGLEASYAETNNVSLTTNVDLQNPIPGTFLPAPLPGQTAFDVGFEDRKRNIYSLYAQDEFFIRDALEITMGMRFDEYSDIGSNLSPRIALVYRKNDHHTIKLQYAEAFRPPTVTELYTLTEFSTLTRIYKGNPNLKPERIDTLEASHIYKNTDTVFRTTLYRSHATDLITLSQTRSYNNDERVISHGIEFELEKSIGDAFKVTANASFNNAENQPSKQPLTGSFDSLAKASIIYQPISRYSATLDLLHVGNQNRGLEDNRPPSGGYNVFNFTYSLFDSGVLGFDIRIGITNLLDTQIVDPSPFGSYPDDLPGPGRSYFFSASKRFR